MTAAYQQRSGTHQRQPAQEQLLRAEKVTAEQQQSRHEQQHTHRRTHAEILESAGLQHRKTQISRRGNQHKHHVRHPAQTPPRRVTHFLFAHNRYFD